MEELLHADVQELESRLHVEHNVCDFPNREDSEPSVLLHAKAVSWPVTSLKCAAKRCCSKFLKTGKVRKLTVEV